MTVQRARRRWLSQLVRHREEERSKKGQRPAPEGTVGNMSPVATETIQDIAFSFSDSKPLYALTSV